MNNQYQTLRLVLGDQLNASHSWYQDKNDSVLYVIAELHQEATYTVHHVQKVQAFFAAMQGFAAGLKQAGFHVLHLTLDDTAKFKSLPELLSHLIQKFSIQQFEYQLADEARLRTQISEFCQSLEIQNMGFEAEHFYVSDQELGQYFKANKKHRLEHFYRTMRARFDILMQNGEPEGGQWNYDKDNREKLKKQDLSNVPQPLLFANDVTEINERIARHNIKTIGKGDNTLLWPINRKQSVELLNFFCEVCLPNFGRFQDAMTGQLKVKGLGEGLDEDQGWSLYHSRISFALNSKILSPKQVVDTAIHYYRQSNGKINLAQIEGFVRQILGWREFVRGVYWANMPNYASLNHLDTTRALPGWFWDANTKMNCQHHAISQSLDYAYAHHIQRLMITGNFCLIAGIDPDEVDAWYLGVYIDAIEWVEMPNTRGMSQFADGGIVGSKAYAASGNYVKKMSDYCSSCAYKVTETVGNNACPLNSLYWHFMHRNQEKLGNNPRTAMVFKNWLKKTDEQRAAVLNQADTYLENINNI